MKSFEKTAFDLTDVEKDVGFYFRDKDEAHVRRLISEQKEKRFPLRHPILTGIPTLGLAPYISKREALGDIKSKLVKKDEWIRREYREAELLRAREALARNLLYGGFR